MGHQNYFMVCLSLKVETFLGKHWEEVTFAYESFFSLASSSKLDPTSNDKLSIFSVTLSEDAYFDDFLFNFLTIWHNLFYL